MISHIISVFILSVIVIKANWPPEYPCSYGGNVPAEPHLECLAKFEYEGKLVEGCSTKYVPEGQSWCSIDSPYNGRWKYCAMCQAYDEGPFYIRPLPANAGTFVVI